MTDEEKAKAEAEAKAKAEADKKNRGPSPLMREAMDAYRLRSAHVLASKDYGDHVVIVTNGGKKLSFASGDKVKELREVDKSGLPPPKPKK